MPRQQRSTKRKPKGSFVEQAGQQEDDIDIPLQEDVPSAEAPVSDRAQPELKPAARGVPQRKKKKKNFGATQSAPATLSTTVEEGAQRPDEDQQQRVEALPPRHDLPAEGIRISMGKAEEGTTVVSVGGKSIPPVPPAAPAVPQGVPVPMAHHVPYGFAVPPGYPPMFPPASLLPPAVPWGAWGCGYPYPYSTPPVAMPTHPTAVPPYGPFPYGSGGVSAGAPQIPTVGQGQPPPRHTQPREVGVGTSPAPPVAKHREAKRGRDDQEETRSDPQRSAVPPPYAPYAQYAAHQLEHRVKATGRAPVSQMAPPPMNATEFPCGAGSIGFPRIRQPLQGRASHSSPPTSARPVEQPSFTVLGPPAIGKSTSSSNTGSSANAGSIHSSAVSSSLGSHSTGTGSSVFPASSSGSEPAAEQIFPRCHAAVVDRTVSLTRIEYDSGTPASNFIIGKIRSRPPDFKLGGICGDCSENMIANLIYFLTGLPVAAIDKFNPKMALCAVWMEPLPSHLMSNPNASRTCLEFEKQVSEIIAGRVPRFPGLNAPCSVPPSTAGARTGGTQQQAPTEPTPTGSLVSGSDATALLAAVVSVSTTSRRPKGIPSLTTIQQAVKIRSISGAGPLGGEQRSLEFDFYATVHSTLNDKVWMGPLLATNTSEDSPGDQQERSGEQCVRVEAQGFNRAVGEPIVPGPAVQGSAWLATDQEGHQYLHRYLEELRALGPTQARFPRHLLRVDRWDSKQ